MDTKRGKSDDERKVCTTTMCFIISSLDKKVEIADP